MRKVARAFWFLLSWWGATAAVWGETVTLMPVADTAIFEAQPDFNFGAQEDLPSGQLGSSASELRSRVLLKFDLGRLPTNAVIQSALLRLTVVRVPDGGGVNSTFEIHRVLRAWGEGTKSGSPPGGAKASAGEATWEARSFPAELWTTPGGEPGADYEAQASSSERVQGTGRYEFEFGPTALAEMSRWIGEPEANFGWLLISQAEDEPRTARRFGAREHPNAEVRPTLTIDYAAQTAVSAPRITRISRSADASITVTFSVEQGVSYRLEANSDLGSGLWSAAAGVATTNAPGELSLTETNQLARWRFYRVEATR